jgi:hypothetical protein
MAHYWNRRIEPPYQTENRTAMTVVFGIRNIVHSRTIIRISTRMSEVVQPTIVIVLSCSPFTHSLCLLLSCRRQWRRWRRGRTYKDDTNRHSIKFDYMLLAYLHHLPSSNHTHWNFARTWVVWTWSCWDIRRKYLERTCVCRLYVLPPYTPTEATEAN